MSVSIMSSWLSLRVRLVQRSEAEELARSHKIAYMEVTATETYKPVQSVFYSAVRTAIGSSAGSAARLRGVNGSSGGARFPMTSSNGSSMNAAGGVLSNLAIPPTILLQKKPLTLTSNNSVTSSTTTTNLSPSNTTTNTTANIGGSRGGSVETDTASSSILSNLRFRANSPPTFVKTLRSPSPGWTIGKPPQLVTPTTLPATNPTPPTAASTTSPGSVRTREKTPVNPHRILATQSLRYPSTNTTATGTAPSPSNIPAGSSPQVNALKKGAISFRFFMKKSK